MAKGNRMAIIVKCKGSLPENETEACTNLAGSNRPFCDGCYVLLVESQLSSTQAELERVKKQLSEAVEVIRFYGDPDSYDREGLPHGFCINFNGLIYDSERVKSYPSDNGKENLSSYGGKRAREFLQKIDNNQLDNTKE